MKKETENTSCKKCDVANFCPFKDIINSCPYIQSYIPIVKVDKTRTKKEISESSFNVGVAIVCVIGIIAYMIILKSCGNIF